MKTKQIAFNEWFRLYIYVPKQKESSLSKALVDGSFDHSTSNKHNSDVLFEIDVHPMNCTQAYNIIKQFKL